MCEHPTPTPLDPGVRLLIAALYDLRLLLGPGAQRPDGRPESGAAALAYALHNEALAALAGEAIDVAEVWARLERMDARLGSAYCERLRGTLRESCGG